MCIGPLALNLPVIFTDKVGEENIGKNIPEERDRIDKSVARATPAHSRQNRIPKLCRLTGIQKPGVQACTSVSLASNKLATSEKEKELAK